MKTKVKQMTGQSTTTYLKKHGTKYHRETKTTKT